MYTYPTLPVSEYHRDGKPQSDLTLPNFLHFLKRHHVCFEEQNKISDNVITIKTVGRDRGTQEKKENRSRL